MVELEPAGYLYSAPDGQQHQVYGVFRLPAYPTWWDDRDARGIVVVGLDAEELKAPLLDIVAKNAHRLLNLHDEVVRRLNTDAGAILTRVIAEQTEEIERLREALTKLRDTDGIIDYRWIARQALEEP